jgi:D-alanyl-D-alanine carboxypeptidase (penicillin-binding protein 5/6)
MIGQGDTAARPLQKHYGSPGLAVFAAGLLLFHVATTGGALAQDVLATKAVTAILVDETSNTLLYAKAANQPFEPGSLAKVMTAAVIFDALKDGGITPDTLFTVSEHAWRTGGAPSRGATMFAAVKSEIAVSDLLQGLLVHNANDAAIVLAEGLAGSEEAFAGRMNALAARLGMTGTHFANPAGFPAPDAKVTARDLSLLAAYILTRHKDQYALFSQPEFTWNNIFQRAKNPFLGEVRGLDGLGAGQSEKDGFSGLVSVERDGRRVIAALSGLPTDKARLAALKDLVEGAWEAFSVNRLFDAGAPVAEARVFGGTAGEVPLVAGRDVDVLLPVGGTMSYRLRAVYDGPLIAPVEKGAQVGEIRVLGPDDTIVYRAPLLTGDAVSEGTLSQRAMNGVRQLLFGWL